MMVSSLIGAPIRFFVVGPQVCVVETALRPDADRRSLSGCLPSSGGFGRSFLTAALTSLSVRITSVWTRRMTGKSRTASFEPAAHTGLKVGRLGSLQPL